MVDGLHSAGLTVILVHVTASVRKERKSAVYLIARVLLTRTSVHSWPLMANVWFEW